MLGNDVGADSSLDVRIDVILLHEADGTLRQELLLDELLPALAIYVVPGAAGLREEGRAYALISAAPWHLDRWVVY